MNTNKQTPAGVRSVYLFKDLNNEAKERARNWFRITNDDPFMQSHMINLLKEELEDQGIKYNDTIDVRYSLSNCQGDGFMFIGEFYWKQYTIYITHSKSRYFHSNTANIEIQETDNLGFHMDEDHEDVKEFYSLYKKVCKTMERQGYDYIDYVNSAEYVDEALEANEYTFTAQGERLDADK